MLLANENYEISKAFQIVEILIKKTSFKTTFWPHAAQTLFWTKFRAASHGSRVAGHSGPQGLRASGPQGFRASGPEGFRASRPQCFRASVHGPRVYGPRVTGNGSLATGTEKVQHGHQVAMDGKAAAKSKKTAPGESEPALANRMSMSCPARC